MHIQNWRAGRSGAAMTVRGVNEADGSDVKISGVKRIETRGRIVVAVADDGAEHILRVG